jgi:hypothetical protein
MYTVRIKLNCDCNRIEASEWNRVLPPHPSMPNLPQSFEQFWSSPQFNAIQPRLSPTSSVIKYAAQRCSCLPSPTIPTKTSFTLYCIFLSRNTMFCSITSTTGCPGLYPPSLLMAALTLRTRAVARPFGRVTLCFY